MRRARTRAYFVAGGSSGITSWGRAIVAAARAFRHDHGDHPEVGVHTTAWWWLGLVASLVALAAAVLAVRLCPGWPEMGSRYDAPVSRPAAEDMSEVDLWRAIDQGRDPTDHDH